MSSPRCHAGAKILARWLKLPTSVLSRVVFLFVGIVVATSVKPAVADAEDPDVADPSTPTPPDAGTAPVDSAAQPETPAEPSPAKDKKHGKHDHDAPAAATPGDGVDPAPAADPGGDGDKAKKRKKANKKHGRLDVRGRVVVRGALLKVRDGGDAIGQGTIRSARAKADYHWKQQLRAQLAVELAGKARLKNAFVQLRLHDDGPRISVRAGNFKMPFSAIELDSFWNLPGADRGLLHDVLAKRFQLAGRAVGATLTVELRGAWKPALTAGVFQGRDDAGDPLAVSVHDRFGQDGVIRVTAKPAHGVELGAAGELRVGQLLVLPAIVRRAWAAELDATIDVDAGPGRVRAWIEGMVGTSWLVADTSKSRATFVAGRGIVGYRIGKAKFGRRYVEPYALIGALDPDSAFGNDLVLEVTGGVTYGASDAWRVQLEVERWKVSANAPVGIAELGIAPATSTTFLIQLGARL